jgi:hypothetical protein
MAGIALVHQAGSEVWALGKEGAALAVEPDRLLEVGLGFPHPFR